MNKRLLLPLLLPLSLVFLLAIFANIIWDTDGFFINLATEVIGILITVGYVDWILRRHEDQKWLSTDARISERLKVILNSTVTTIRVGLGVSHDIFDERVMRKADSNLMHGEVIRVAEHVLIPMLPQRIRSLDQNGWKILARNLQLMNAATMEFINNFRARLSPTQMNLLLDLDESLRHALISYRTFPDVLGVPDDQLPPSKTPPKEIQERGCTSTAMELQKVLTLTKELSNTIA